RGGEAARPRPARPGRRGPPRPADGPRLAGAAESAGLRRRLPPPHADAGAGGRAVALGADRGQDTSRPAAAAPGPRPVGRRAVHGGPPDPGAAPVARRAARPRKGRLRPPLVV